MVGFNVLAVASVAALTLLSGVNAGVIVERTSDIIAKRNAPLLGSCLSYTNYTYVGCYYDSQNPRLLPLGSNLEFQTMTIDKCIAFCKGNNFKYAGIEYYGQCFCGETLPGSPAAASNCQYPCNGASGQNCGGNSYMSIFQDPTYPAPVSGTGDYGQAGCWSDDTNMRTLPYGQTASGSTMTTESCLAACKAGGYPLAGTEYGSECYCGVVLSNIAVQQADSACTYPCAGNTAETCGGPNLLNLWVARDLESNKPCTSYSGSVPPTPSPTPTTSTSKPPPPTTTSTPPPPPSATCVGKPGQGSASVQINQLWFNDIGDCANACHTNSACKSFAFGPSNGACFLYNAPVATSLATPQLTSPFFFFDVTCTTYNIPPPPPPSTTSTPPPPPTTTAPPPPPPSVTCVGKPGQGSASVQINQLWFNNIGDCANACHTNSACKSFAFGPSNGACFLYNAPVATSLATPQLTSPFFFFDITCTTFNIPPPVTCVGKPGQGSASVQINQLWFNDIGDCGNACYANNACKSFAFGPSNGACFLYSAPVATSLATPQLTSPFFFFDITCTTWNIPPPVTCVGKPGQGSASVQINQLWFNNIGDCANACYANNACKSFAFGPSNGACFLYNAPVATSLATPQLTSPFFFFDLGCTTWNIPPPTATTTAPPPPPPSVTCVGKPGYGSSSCLITQLSFSDIGSCGNACKGNSACKSFSWGTNNGACYLYNLLIATSLLTQDVTSPYFFFDYTCTTWNMPPPPPTTTKPPPPPATTVAPPLCTTVLPGKCDFKIGNWCAPTLPSWTDQTSCNTGASQCKVQLGSCWGLAGWPASGNCIQYSNWCDSCTSYCKTPSLWHSGKCSDSDFKSKNSIAWPPTDGSNKPTTIVGPCTPTPTPTVVPVPTYAPICVQPNSPSKGYSSTSPVGGIWMPCLTCNNDKLDFGLGNIFKLFNNPLSSLCSTYKSSGAAQGCKDACMAQFNSCKGTYAQGCQGKVQWGSQDSFNSATNKCTQQYSDCLSANSNPLKNGSPCGGFNIGWSW